MDLGAIVDGLYGDSAVTVAVGDVSEGITCTDGDGEARRCSPASLRHARAIALATFLTPWSRRSCGAGLYGIVREYVGHGIGTQLHEEPSVPNFGPSGHGPLLRPGMAIAIEPMVNFGGDSTTTLGDGWTVVTVQTDRYPSTTSTR